MKQILENSEIQIKIEKGSKNDFPYLLLIFEGKLSMENIRELSEGLKLVFDDFGDGVILVNLAKLTYVNSTGLALLLSMWKRASEENQKILFIDIHPFLEELFELTELSQKFTIVESLEKAFEMIKE